MGSCHLSIKIDDVDELTTFHQQVQEKEIKIGKKRTERRPTTPSADAKEESTGGKLKFKVYTTALAAYLKYGKNYGDKLREHQLVDVLIAGQ